MLIPYLAVFLLGQNPSLASERATEPLARCQAAIRDPIDAIAFLKSPQVLAVHQRGAPIELLAWEKGKKSTSHVLEATRARDVVFSPNGEVCAFYQDDKIKLWNLSRNVLEKSVAVPHSAVPHTLGLSADGKFMAIAVDDPDPRSQESAQKIEDRGKFRIYVVSIASGQTIANLSGYMGPVRSIAFSNNGKMIAAGTAYARDALAFVWDVPKATRLAELKGQPEICSTVAFSPDDSLLATASGLKHHGTVQLWDTRTWKRLHELIGHYRGGVCLAFSPDGNLLASGSFELILWDVKSGRNVTRPGPAVVLWDSLANEGRVAHEAVRTIVSSLQFSRDGKTLAVGGVNGDATLWDVKTLVNRAGEREGTQHRD